MYLSLIKFNGNENNILLCPYYYNVLIFKLLNIFVNPCSIMNIYCMGLQKYFIENFIHYINELNCQSFINPKTTKYYNLHIF